MAGRARGEPAVIKQLGNILTLGAAMALFVAISPFVLLATPFLEYRHRRRNDPIIDGIARKELVLQLTAGKVEEKE
jgi:hypothetical protein